MSRRRFDWSPLRRPSVARGVHADRAAERAGVVQSDLDPPSEAAESGAAAAHAGEATTPGWAMPPLQSNEIEIRVNDLKQFAYCPRIVFYQYTMPVERRTTFKMEHGKSVEVRTEDLEKRRKLREYGLGAGKRRFQVWMRSRRLGLSGRVDLLIETADGMFPVDFKDTTAPVHHNHRVQLCAYALLIEDTFHRPAHAGFIYRIPRNDVTAIEMSPALRTETIQTIGGIRTLIGSERMPDATPVRARCTDCEYRNYCADVF